MTKIAIISEYNPFHNGHKYQILKIKEMFGEDAYIICVMSGNFVQRGDFAIYPKHERAEMAVRSGADLVVELPLVFALSSAESFAKGAVSVLEKIGDIDYLCFGSECGEIDEIINICEALETKKVSENIKEALKSGVSYPKALDLALGNVDKKYSEIVKNPNNTLGIEYVKAIKKLKSKIKPITIKRKNVEHNSQIENDGFASATYIRGNLKKKINHLIPKESNIIFDIEKIVKKNDNAILSYLKRGKSEYFVQIADVTEGLENKIVKSLKEATSLEDLYEKIKSKRFTKSKIRRIIMCSYIGIKKEFQSENIRYIKVLAFKESVSKYVKTISENCDIPIILKPSLEVKTDEFGRKMLELDELATDLYFMGSVCQNDRISGNEKRKSPKVCKKNCNLADDVIK